MLNPDGYRDSIALVMLPHTCHAVLKLRDQHRILF